LVVRDGLNANFATVARRVAQEHSRLIAQNPKAAVDDPAPLVSFSSLSSAVDPRNSARAPVSARSPSCSLSRR
jgi:hypothetical protein